MENLNVLKDRRKDSLIRTGNRFNFERRDTYRLLINGDIFVNNDLKVCLINIDYMGACISSPNRLYENTLTMDLNPYLDLLCECNITWKEENIDENVFVYGLEFINLDEYKTKYLEENLLLNTELFIEHANNINSSITNIDIKNKVINFFLEDVKSVLQKFLTLKKEISSAKIEKINQETYSKIAKNLDDLLFIG
ncbi:hypothetical protein ACFL5N_02945, partial [bacterium]